MMRTRSYSRDWVFIVSIDELQIQLAPESPVVADGTPDVGLGSTTSIVDEIRTMGNYNMPCFGDAPAVGYNR